MRLLSGGKGGGRGAEEGPFRRHNHSPPHPIPLSHSISLSAPPGTGPKRSAGTASGGHQPLPSPPSLTVRRGSGSSVCCLSLRFRGARRKTEVGEC